MEPITNSLRNLYEFLSHEQLTLPTEQVNEFSQSFGLTNEEIAQSVQKLEHLRNSSLGVDAQFKQLSAEVGLTREQFNQLNEAVESTTGQSQLQQFASDAIARFMDLSDAFADSALKIYDDLKPGLEALARAGSKTTDLLITGFKATFKALEKISQVIKPILNFLARYINALVGGIERTQTFIALFTGGLDDSKQAVQSYQNIVTQMGNEATRTQEKLKEVLEARQNVEKNGIPITREQLAQEKLYRQFALEQIEAMKEQRKELLTANIVGKENKEAVKAQIVELENQIAALEKQEQAFANSNSTELISFDSQTTAIETYYDRREGRFTEDMAFATRDMEHFDPSFLTKNSVMNHTIKMSWRVDSLPEPKKEQASGEMNHQHKYTRINPWDINGENPIAINNPSLSGSYGLPLDSNSSPTFYPNGSGDAQFFFEAIEIPIFSNITNSGNYIYNRKKKSLSFYGVNRYDSKIKQHDISVRSLLLGDTAWRDSNFKESAFPLPEGSTIHDIRYYP